MSPGRASKPAGAPQLHHPQKGNAGHQENPGKPQPGQRATANPNSRRSRSQQRLTGGGQPTVLHWANPPLGQPYPAASVANSRCRHRPRQSGRETPRGASQDTPRSRQPNGQPATRLHDKAETAAAVSANTGIPRQPPFNTVLALPTVTRPHPTPPPPPSNYTPPAPASPAPPASPPPSPAAAPHRAEPSPYRSAPLVHPPPVRCA